MNPIPAIESLLNIKLEKYDYNIEQDNYYRLREEGYFEYLKISNVYLDGPIIEELLLYTNRIMDLKIYDSTVSNIAEIAKFQSYSLSIHNVIFEKDYYQETILKDYPLECHTDLLTISWTTFNVEALQGLNNFWYCDLIGCTISNFDVLGEFPNLYQLRLIDNKYLESSILYPKRSNIDKKILLKITESVIENLDFLLPFAHRIWQLQIENSTIENISALRQFKVMHTCIIDTDSILKQDLKNDYSTIFPTLNQVTLEIKCTGLQGNFQQFAPIANYFNQLSFKDFKEDLITNMELFSNVDYLSFENCKIDLSFFFPIAQNIRIFYIRNSIFEQPELWYAFKNITSIYLGYFEDNLNFGGLHKLLPLKNQLKHLFYYDSTDKGNYLHGIEEFKFLEILNVKVNAEEAVQAITTLSNLEQLSISFYFEGTFIIANLERMKKLKHLFANDVYYVVFQGFEHLKELNVLEIEDGYFDVSLLPYMPSLKRLALDACDSEIHKLDHLPNLEELKVRNALSLNLENLTKLKILDLNENHNFKNFDFFKDVPQLEKLSLERCFLAEEYISLFSLQALDNLKWLCLRENDEIMDLDGIEALTSLEYLNLYGTKFEEVGQLNRLPNLKEVNLATEAKISAKELLAQLDRPEIAVFKGLPYIYFSVWERIYLWKIATNR